MFLNFFEISKIPFKEVLEHLQITYTETIKELKGQGFIVSKGKNKYFNPTGTDKGSVINFVANHNEMSLRDAAEMLYKEFKAVAESPGIPEYDLHYCEFLEKEGISESIAKEWEVGLVKNHKGPAAGRIAFKIMNGSQKVGYALLNPKDGSWFYFSGYKHDYIYGLNHYTNGVLYPNPLLAVKNQGLGLTHPGLTEAQEQALIHNLNAIQVNDLRIANRLMKYIFVKLY
jgi:hypothetical protein